jgi:Arc/MetJ-type ribon-helix-helix transcriptional regulator
MVGYPWRDFMTPRAKKAVKYQSVSLSVPFIEKIKLVIKDRPEYRSVADYVRESVREKIAREHYINPKVASSIASIGALNEDDLVTLCYTCHEKITRLNKKKRKEF